MNSLAVWLIYIFLWWTIDDERDVVLYRYSRQYWRGVDSLIKFGLWATLIFLITMFLFSLDDTCSSGTCEMRLLAFLDAPANEVGDTLAGLAGGMAFLWLTVTVMLQGKELAAQRQELALTRQETSRMADAMASQTEVLLLEKNKLIMDGAENLFSQKLQALQSLVSRHKDGSLSIYDDLISQFTSAVSVDQGEMKFFETLLSSAGDLYSTYRVTPEAQNEPLGPLLSHLLEQADEKLEEISEIEPQLSQAQLQRLKNLRLHTLHAVIQLTLEIHHRQQEKEHSQ